MPRLLKLEHPFNTAANLEVEYLPGVWNRVTANWFRSFVGQRRIDNQPYKGPVYYEGTNIRYRKVKSDRARILSIEELNDKRLVERYRIKVITPLPGTRHRTKII